MSQRFLLQDVQDTVRICSWTASFECRRRVLISLCFFDLTEKFQAIFIAAVDNMICWALFFLIFFINLDTFLDQTRRAIFFSDFERFFLVLLRYFFSHLSDLFLVIFEIFSQIGDLSYKQSLSLALIG